MPFSLICDFIWKSHCTADASLNNEVILSCDWIPASCSQVEMPLTSAWELLTVHLTETLPSRLCCRHSAKSNAISTQIYKNLWEKNEDWCDTENSFRETIVNMFHFLNLNL